MPGALLSDLSVYKMRCRQEKHPKEREGLSPMEEDRRHLAQTTVKASSAMNPTMSTSPHKANTLTKVDPWTANVSQPSPQDGGTLGVSSQ